MCAYVHICICTKPRNKISPAPGQSRCLETRPKITPVENFGFFYGMTKSGRFGLGAPWGGQADVPIWPALVNALGVCSKPSPNCPSDHIQIFSRPKTGCCEPLIKKGHTYKLTVSHKYTQEHPVLLSYKVPA